MAVGFGDRLAYAGFLFHLRQGRPPVFAEIAREIGVTAPWLTKWSRREDAPDSRALGRGLAKALGISEAWLLDDEGVPPEPEIWARWASARGLEGSAAEPLPAGAKHGRGGIPAHEALAAERAATARKKKGA